MSEKWDRYFMRLAADAASASKDPSTKVGAVIVDRNRRTVITAYNGFPRGCDDSPELYADRDRKYLRTVHAEANALLFARRCVEGCTVYTTPFPPCARCAALLIQAGIARVVSPPTPPDLLERWGADLAEAREMFREVGVILGTLEAS